MGVIHPVPSTFKVIERKVAFITPVNRSRLSDDVMGRDGLVVKCPKGHRPIDHRVLSANNTTRRSLHAIFDGDICRECSVLGQCPVRASNHRCRGCKPQNTVGNFPLEITPELRLRDQMYTEQQTDEWKEKYGIRSGIEATISELKRSHGMGKLHVRRAAKVSFAVACKVIACNIKRWAKAYTGSGKTFRRLVWSILRHLRAYEDNLNKICFGVSI